MYHRILHKEKIFLEPGILTFDIIQQIYNILNVNTASVPTSLGGGKHGCLMLTLTNEEYNTFAGAVADHPMNPGETLPTLNNPFELAQKGEDCILSHMKKFQTYRIYKGMDTALWSLLTNVVEESFMLSVKKYNNYIHYMEKHHPRIWQK